MFHDYINSDIYINPEGYLGFFQIIRFNGNNLSEIKMMFPEYECDVVIVDATWGDIDSYTLGLEHTNFKQDCIGETYCVLADGTDLHTVPIGGYFLRCIGEWENCAVTNPDKGITKYEFISSCATADVLDANFVERSAYIERLMRATNEAWDQNAQK